MVGVGVAPLLWRDVRANLHGETHSKADIEEAVIEGAVPCLLVSHGNLGHLPLPQRPTDGFFEQCS